MNIFIGIKIKICNNDDCVLLCEYIVFPNMKYRLLKKETK